MELEVLLPIARSRNIRKEFYSLVQEVSAALEDMKDIHFKLLKLLILKKILNMREVMNFVIKTFLLFHKDL